MFFGDFSNDNFCNFSSNLVSKIRSKKLLWSTLLRSILEFETLFLRSPPFFDYSSQKIEKIIEFDPNQLNLSEPRTRKPVIRRPSTDRALLSVRRPNNYITSSANIRRPHEQPYDICRSHEERPELALTYFSGHRHNLLLNFDLVSIRPNRDWKIIPKLIVLESPKKL